MNKQPKRKYWIKKTTWYCPVCGSEKVFRERMFTPKPKEDSKRYIFKEVYDWCQEEMEVLCDYR